jgi:transglutaminase-like putative cysteine protease
VPDAHDELDVTGTSTVETHPDGQRPSAGWEQVRDPRTQDRFAELLAATALTTLPDELAGECDRLRAAADPVTATAEAVRAVHGGLRYQRGGTNTMTTAADAWAAGHGVCQDFVHLTLAILRHIGIPSRYVSGYVHPSAAAVAGETVDAESHAWVEAWTGAWWGIDPTNDIPADHRHVIVARGRDYADVPPIKGVYAGPADQQMAVTVRITRVRLP